MNWLLLLSTVLSQIPTVIHGVQAVAGDVTAGKTKNQMAVDALTSVANDEATALTGNNAALAQLAAGSVMLAIQGTDAISKAVTKAKGTPSFQAATDAGNKLVQASTAPAAQAA